MKVLHVDTNHPILIEGLEALGCTNEEDYNSNYDEILEKIASFDGLIIRSRFPVDRQFLDKAVNLKFIGRVGAGLENIDQNYAEKKGVFLIAAPEGNRNAVGEHTLGMLLGLLNKLCKANSEVRKGVWDREGNRGLELDGSTVGIIGYGNTGKAFAKKLSGFEVEVLCNDIIPGVGDAYARQVDLEELKAQCNIVSLHLPLTPLTNEMVDKNFISDFTRPFWFLNTARGQCVVTEDLVSGLRQGKILGAGLDVLEYEKTSFESLNSDSGAENAFPPALKYLLSADNVLITPHVAGWTIESKELLARTIVDKISKRFF